MSDASVIAHVPLPVRWAASLFAVLAIAVTLFLLIFNWDMLRGPVAREASKLSGHPVRIDGHLQVHLWTWTPTVTIGDLKIGNPSWMKGGGDLADVRSLTVSVRLVPLFSGRIELPLVDIEYPNIALYRDASGRANWAGEGQKPAKPLKLPPIQNFVINTGHLKWVDEPRKMTVTGTIQSHETNVKGGSGAFQLNGDGSINAAPFVLRLTGGALLNVHHDQPYAFVGELRAGDTRITANGALPRPFDFGQVDTALTVQGHDLSQLYEVTGLVLPNSPPYRLSGRLSRNGKVYTFTKVAGQVGHSDLEGEFRVDDTTGRPAMRANLRSRRLDFKDLGPLVGAPAAGDRTPLQQAQAAQRVAEHRLLPDATLNVERVRKMDAVLDYRADSVIAAPTLPLRQVKLHLVLDHGVLTMNPIAFDFPRGELAGKVRLDASEAVPRTDLDLHVTNIHLEDFFKSGANPPLEGILEARAKLHGVGDSVHKAASTADGSVTFVTPKGEIRRAFAELMGIDVIQGLGLFLAKNQSDTGVRCAVADFQAVNGVLQARNLVMDTDPVVAYGRGDINLATEAINLQLTGKPKKFTVLHLSAPIVVGGHLSAPTFGVKPGAIPAQLVGAAALGAVLGPAAAILPFVDPGLAHDANCAAIMAQAQAKGTPVKPSMTTPLPAKHH